MGGGRVAEMLSRYGGAAAVVAAATAVTVITITARRVASVDVVADLQVRLGIHLLPCQLRRLTLSLTLSPFLSCYAAVTTTIRLRFDGRSTAIPLLSKGH